MTLGGTVALVTGAARGIGRATAAGLVGAGARVVLADVDREVGEVAAAVGGEPEIVDLVEEADLVRLVRGIVERHGRLDALVNNAGVGRHNPVERLRTDDLDLMWAVNVRAPVLLCREAFRVMASQPEGGQIANVVSTAGLAGGPGESAYCATKFALRGFTQGLAEEGRLAGIRVHGVYPAGVDTGFWAAATASGPGVEPKVSFLQPDDVAEAVVAALASPAHLHVPEIVLRAVADADHDAIRRKLEWFRQ